MKLEFTLPDGRDAVLTNEVAASKHGEPVLMVGSQTLDATDLLEAGGRNIRAACLVRELLHHDLPAAVREFVAQFIRTAS